MSKAPGATCAEAKCFTPHGDATTVKGDVKSAPCADGKFWTGINTTQCCQDKKKAKDNIWGAPCAGGKFKMGIDTN